MGQRPPLAHTWIKDGGVLARSIIDCTIPAKSDGTTWPADLATLSVWTSIVAAHLIRPFSSAAATCPEEFQLIPFCCLFLSFV